MVTELGKMIKEEDIKEGIKEGKEQANIATAKNMIKKGFSDKDIIDITELTQDDLNKIKKSLN